ncbi:MAG: hypothetical protein VKP62_06225 [Candidatus Sericytochromatia bacterium]|nr:hypothetical protein [Candidatus Sericytochromatia bacterium]
MPFTLRVVESSAPDLGQAQGGGVANCPVTMTGDRDGTTNFTTNGSGNLSGQYKPESTPTFVARKWSISDTGGPGSTLTLRTDASMKLGMEASGAPEASGQTFTITAAANGGGNQSLSRAISAAPAVPTFLKVPRSGDGVSTIAVTAVDHPRFTWDSDAPLNLTASANIGKISNSTMRFRAIHKWVKVTVNFKLPTGVTNTEGIDQIELSAYPYLVDAASRPVYGAKIKLPAATLTDGSIYTQTNPTLKGGRLMYFLSRARLAAGLATYHEKLLIHAEGGFWISKPDLANELITIDDAARVSGAITKNIELEFNGGGK